MSSIKSMDTPRSRREFERNLNLLAERIRAGKMHFSCDVKMTINDISAVKYLPNKRIDLLTVSEFVRMMGNQCAMLEDHVKKNGIANSDIHNES